MELTLQEKIKTLIGLKVYDVIKDPPSPEVTVKFENGAWIRASYWRLIGARNYRVSSFDHNQKYGLPAPVDAPEEVQLAITNKTVTEAQFNSWTGDIILYFGNELSLEVLNFTGYEAWELSFDDDSGEYSNYV